MESDTDKSSQSQTSEMVSCLPEEQIQLEQIERQSPTKNDTISESTSNSNLEIQSENADMNKDSSLGLTCTASSSSVIKTKPIEQLCLEKQSEDKDVLERISEGESYKRNESEMEVKCSPSSKTSHSEKIVAAVVNPYV